MAALKPLHDKILQGAKDLLEAIENQPSWAWCRRSKELTDPLKNAVGEIGAIKSSNDLWKAWTLKSNFVAHCVKYVDEKDVDLAFDNDFVKMKDSINLLETQTTKLKRMQAANM